MKKRTMLVAGLGAAGALFLSVHAWTASAAPVTTPVPNRCMSFIDEMTTEYVIIRKTGRMLSSPIALKGGKCGMETASAAGAISTMHIIRDIVIRDVITDA